MKRFNNFQLGIFVMAGLVFLILGLYFIGKDENIFGSNFRLKTRFTNAAGLVPGNNVLYAGIQVGTVKRVELLNDTLIEVTMAISEKVRGNIRNNAVASITTEGFIGNKIVNITPGKGVAPSVRDNDILAAKPVINTDDMLETLAVSNRNLLEITDGIRETVARINSSTALWRLLQEDELPENIRRSAENIRNSSATASLLLEDLRAVVTDVRSGKGSLGSLLTDTTLAIQLSEATQKIGAAGESARLLAEEISGITSGLEEELQHGNGIATALLRDSLLTIRLTNTLSHIEEGTEAFRENMEALKHNFLLRGYFKRQEKQKKNPSRY